MLNLNMVSLNVMHILEAKGKMDIGSETHKNTSLALSLSGEFEVGRVGLLVWGMNELFQGQNSHKALSRLKNRKCKQRRRAE